MISFYICITMCPYYALKNNRESKKNSIICKRLI